MRRTALALLLASAAAVGLYLLAAVAGALWTGPVAPVPAGGPVVRVGMVTGPIHTDLLLPLTDDLRAQFGFAAVAGIPVDDPQAQWLVVGWGSRAFYTATGSYGDLRAATVWRAATGDTAVLRLDVAGPIAPDAPEVRWVTLGPQQMQALTLAVLGSMAGTASLPDPGFTATDAFFPATGRFHLFRTCNAWVSEVLRAAGQPFGLWTPAPYSVRLSAWWFAD